MVILYSLLAFYSRKRLGLGFLLMFMKKAQFVKVYNELTKEQIEKAIQCKTADELMALAKSKRIDLTKAEAEAYLAELDDFEMDEAMLKNWLAEPAGVLSVKGQFFVFF